jgi:hypothetical protein
LAVSSLPAAVNNLVTVFAHQTGTGGGTFTPTWTVATNNSLIAGRSPSSASGNFSLEAPGRSVSALTASNNLALTLISGGASFPITTSTNYVTCGNGAGAGASLVYSLAGSPTGYNLTNIVVYGGWADAGRDQQAYTIACSSVGAPGNFTTLASVNFNPANPARAQSATRMTLAPDTGVLATNVAAVKFDFSSPVSENGYCGYGAITVFGTPTQTVVSPSTNATHLTFRFDANSVTFSWPSDHIGWWLQVQTNALNVGLADNWRDVPGSTATNRMIIPIDATGGCTFYRLAYP